MLEGAFLVLEALAQLGEAGPTQIADVTGLPKATAHRLLVQLADIGAVQRRSGRYRMGSRMFRLGQARQPVPTLRAAARNPLRQFAAAVPGATVGIMIPEAGRTITTCGIRGEVRPANQPLAGLMFPHGCAAGREGDDTGHLTVQIGQ